MRRGIRCRRGGFTLIEMSIVLLIIALVTGASLALGKSQIAAARRAATEKRMDAIEASLAMFRESTGRVPCPADPALAKSNANYGDEAGSAEADLCDQTVTTRTANDVAEGAVPVRTLGLPDDYINDGWGRKFTYAVAARFAQTDAFNIIPIYDACSAAVTEPKRIIVKNAADAVVSRNAVYLILSHGVNGHGGYTVGGTRLTAGSTNAQEQENCDCNASATAGAYDRTYVQRALLEDSTAVESFDDMVRYKERAQLQSAADGLVPNDSYFGIDYVSFAPGDANLALKNMDCSTLVDSSPATVAVADGMDVKAMAFSGRNTYLGITGAAGGTDTAAVYKRTGRALAALASQPDVQPAGTPTSIDFSMDESYMAIGTTASPYVYMYARRGDTFNKTANPTTLPGAAVTAVKFAPNNAFLVVGQEVSAAKILRIYTHSAGVFTALTQPSVQPAGTVTSALAVSPDSVYFAVGSDASPYVTIYKRTRATFAKLADPADLPGGQVNGLSFSHDGNFLAVGSSADPYIYVYARSGDTFTLLQDLNDGDESDGTYQLQFSPFHNRYLFARYTNGDGDDEAGFYDLLRTGYWGWQAAAATSAAPPVVFAVRH